MTHQMAPPKTHDITLHLLDWTQETLSQVRQVNTSVTDRRCSSYNISRNWWRRIKLPVSLRFADDWMYFGKQYYCKRTELWAGDYKYSFLVVLIATTADGTHCLVAYLSPSPTVRVYPSYIHSVPVLSCHECILGSLPGLTALSF